MDAPPNLPLPEPLGPLTYPLGLEETTFASVVPANRSPNPPKITVVTPSFNQGQYLETTIRSVLSQGYPNLEYFVIDGGSTDHSVQIIRHYEPWLSGWVSERDGGQTDAISKGLARTTGKWFNWINSDDLLAPGALWALARADCEADLLAGVTVEFLRDHLIRTVTNEHLSVARLLVDEIWHQPSVWMRPGYAQGVGIDQTLQYRFDYFLMLRYLSRHPNVRLVPDTLAYFRLHDTSKTMSARLRFLAEKQAGLRKLIEDPYFAERRPQLDMMIRKLEWRNRMESVAAQRHRSRWARIWELLGEVANDRQARCTATTRRALIRLALRGGRRRQKLGRAQ